MYAVYHIRKMYAVYHVRKIYAVYHILKMYAVYHIRKLYADFMLTKDYLNSGSVTENKGNVQCRFMQGKSECSKSIDELTEIRHNTEGVDVIMTS